MAELASVPLSVFIVADVRLYRDGLADTLRKRDRLDVVGAVADIREGLLALCETNPDVI